MTPKWNQKTVPDLYTAHLTDYEWQKCPKCGSYKTSHPDDTRTPEGDVLNHIDRLICKDCEHVWQFIYYEEIPAPPTQLDQLLKIREAAIAVVAPAQDKSLAERISELEQALGMYTLTNSRGIKDDC